MWHEARKQEKKIRGMMVDYKRRAERRRDYYEKIKQDPAQFLQVHGRPAKIHLDPAVAMAADSPATMMPWQGHNDNLIDRFDVRAHLDIIPDYNATKNVEDPIPEDRQACYERYRTLVQNEFLGVGEDKFLNQIFMEERFGIFRPDEDTKKKPDKKAAIGYVYEDSTESPPPLQLSSIPKDDEDEEENEEKEEDLSDIDLDVTVDVSMLTPAQCAEMNEHSLKFGMVDDDFITYLLQDKDEAEQLKLAREIEEEKAMYSGRKSRRERRALREKKLAGRKITSPPSYAARDSPTYTPMRQSASKSRSRSPPDAGKIMFITSFGGEGSDGEQLGKTTEKSAASGVKQGKSTKLKETAVSVIGPQLPSKNGDEEKNSQASSKHSSHSGSVKSHRSKSKHDKDKKRESRRRSRHSSRSSSAHSPSPRKSTSRDRKSGSRRTRSRSRSHSTSKSRSRSRSRRQNRTNSRSKSRSRSKSTSKANPEKSQSPQLPPPPIKSYYRHSLSRSNSDLTDESEDEEKSPIQSPQISGVSRLQPLLGKAAPATKTKLTPQERLKRKMQLALKKQYKADKKAQMEKTEKQLQERQDRAEELREMAIKLRQRERERRHKMQGYDSDSDTTWSKNPDYLLDTPENSRSKRNNAGSGRSSSYSSPERSPPPTASSSRRRSRSKSPRSSRRSSVEDRSRRRSPYRRRSPRHSPRRSPHARYRRSPVRSGRSRVSPGRRYSPARSPRRRSRSPVRRRSPSRSDRRYTSRSHRQGNRSSSRSRSPSRSYGTRPLVDY